MKYSFSPHQYLLSMLQVVLTRMVLGSVSTGRYGGNSNNGSPQNPDCPPGQPMSDDHRDHLDDHCMTIFYGGALDVEVSGSFGWVDKPGGLVRVTKYTADR